MSVHLSQIPAVASLQSHLTTLVSVPRIEPYADLIAISDIVSQITQGSLTAESLEELRALADDARASLWEHGEATGALTVVQVANRSSAAEDWYLRQPSVHGDTVDAVLRQTCLVLGVAVKQCETLLP